MKNRSHFLPLFALLALLTLLAGCQARKTIVNELDEKEANEILVFLSSKGVQANKVPRIGGGGAAGQKGLLFDIAVDAEDATEAMALLNQQGLPRRRPQTLLDIFRTTTLVPSELQEEVRYQAGLSEQIASTIRKMDGVLDSEVQISFPKEDPLNPEASAKKKITASVYIKHSGVLDDPNVHLATKIKRLVAGSVTGLNIDDVTVIADRARFGEIPFGRAGAAVDEEKEYVSLWTVIVAIESVTRFRLIFFSFFTSLLLLALLLVWVLWKVLPLLGPYGGIAALFRLQPLVMEAPSKKGTEETEEEREAEEGEEEGKEEEEGVT